MDESTLPVPPGHTAGRPKKGEKRPKSKILPALELDFTKDPADHILPCSEREQAHHLEWYVDEVRSVNRILGLYDKLPMLCPGEKCYWAELCPTKPDFMFVGLRCPLEIVEVWRLFFRYVQELRIYPDRHVDLSMIADLVRIDLQIHRIDQQIQIQGMLRDEVAAVVQNTGEAKYKKVIHPLIPVQCKLREQRDRIYEDLVATRDAREKAEREKGKTVMDAMELMRRLKEMAQKRSPELVTIDVPGLVMNKNQKEQPREEEPDFSSLLPRGE